MPQERERISTGNDGRFVGGDEQVRWQPASRQDWQEGPTGKAPTTESVGDPEADDVESGAEGGAATGALLGTAVGGPVGAIVGGVIGGAAGAAGEAADSDADRGYERREEGTGPIDPIYEEPR